MQHRHQKVLEEAPAPDIDETAREEAFIQWIEACIEIGYRVAGTFGFLYEDRRAYLIEISTRVQVAHPVSEMVTSIDILKEMLSIAADNCLSFIQNDVIIRSHSFECRLNAENARTFIPRSRAELIEEQDRKAGKRSPRYTDRRATAIGEQK